MQPVVLLKDVSRKIRGAPSSPLFFPQPFGPGLVPIKRQTFLGPIAPFLGLVEHHLRGAGASAAGRGLGDTIHSGSAGRLGKAYGSPSWQLHRGQPCLCPPILLSTAKGIFKGEGRASTSPWPPIQSKRRHPRALISPAPTLHSRSRDTHPSAPTLPAFHDHKWGLRGEALF